MANRTKIEKLEDLIKDTIGGELVEQTVTSLVAPGENFGSVMYKVDFKVKKDGKEKEYHAVAKCTPLNPVTQKVFNIQETFKAEIAWYTTVIPTLKQFQKNHKVEKEIDFFQQFYGARISLDSASDIVDREGILLTQNLKYLGYYNIDKQDGFDLPTSYAVLRDLAMFHAVSLALKRQDPELFDRKIKPHLPSFGDKDGEMHAAVNKRVLRIFEHIPECQSIMGKITKNVNAAIMFTGRPVREPWVSLVHMDFWNNNIMVTGGKDSKSMFLDLQFPCVGTPAADLVFFLFTSVNLDVVQTNLDDFIEFYFEQFSKNLKELNVSTDDFTLQGLLKEMETEVKIGEFGHSLSHTMGIMEVSGTIGWEPSDENFKLEDYANDDRQPTAKQIAKFRWIALEANKRDWI